MKPLLLFLSLAFCASSFSSCATGAKHVNACDAHSTGHHGSCCAAK